MARRPEVPRTGSAVANIVAAIVLLAAVAAIPVIVANWDDWTSSLRREVDSIPSLQVAELQQQTAGSESLLVLVTDPTDQIAAIALVAAVDDAPALLNVIPATLFDLLPGYGDFALAEAVVFEGPELARIATSNALGVRIDRVATIASGAFAAAAPPLEIDLPEPMLVVDDSTTVQLADAGAAVFDGALAERLLSERGESTQIGWLERQAAVWSALLPAVADDPGFAASLLGEGRAAALLRRAIASSAEVALIPVTPVGVAGAEDGFQLVQVEVLAFVNSRLGHLALASEPRARVEVLNGNGEVLATRPVVEAVVAAGFHVVKTDNADNFDFEETVVIAQGRANRSVAATAAATVGVKMVQLELTAPSGVVDVSIIVGRDIATLRS